MELRELKAYLKNLPDILDAPDQKKRKALALKSFERFARTYFSHHIGGDVKETSEFRKFIYKNIETLAKNNTHLLFESYRGSAKTTLITRLFTLYSLIKGKKYAVIISSTLDIAKESLETIKTEIEDNAKLKSDFGLEIGHIWTSEEIVFSAEGRLKKIKAFGAGKKIRGTNFLGSRPDQIILDDIENDENVQSKAQRDKLYSWYFKAVLKLVFLNSKNYNYIVVGTRLHHDGLLARLSGVYEKSFKFKLVKEFPPFLDEITKRNYEDFNYDQMILDDSLMDKKAVMKLFLDDKESFYSEYQNEPLSRDGAIFSGYKTYEQMPPCDAYYIGLDPAMGKARGDYFGLAVIGVVRGGDSSADYGSREPSRSLARDPADGAGRFSSPQGDGSKQSAAKGGLRSPAKYYLDAKGYKLNPGVMIDKFIQLYLRLLLLGKPIKIAIETIAFQEFFKDKLKEEFAKKGISLSVCELKNSVAKELRLDALAPYITDGTILVNVDNTLLIEELDTYPKAPHDDLLDASEMAFRIASGAGIADYRALNRVVKRNQKLIKSLKERYA